MERAQTRKDTPTEPTTVASLSGVSGGMYFSLENDEILPVPGKLECTHMVEYPVQFVVQPVRKARKQAPSSTEHHVTQ